MQKNKQKGTSSNYKIIVEFMNKNQYGVGCLF